MKNTLIRLSLIVPAAFLLLALAVLLSPTHSARASSGDLHVYTSTLPGPDIPDNLCVSGAYVTQTISVPDNFPIGKVRVGVNMTHTSRNDLVVRLTAPDGSSAIVLNRVTGTYDNLDVLLDDASSANPGGPPGWVDLVTDSPYYEYTWRPSTALSLFRYRNSSGAWQLSACDAGYTNAGQMNFFGLFLEEGTAGPTYIDSSMSVTPATPLPPASVATFSTVIANNGTLAGSATLSDVLPSGSTYVASSAGVEPAGSGTLTVTQSDIQWSGPVGPGEKVTVTFQVNVVAVNGWITNTATISDPLSDAPVVRTASISVAAPAYAGSSKSVAPLTGNQLLPGQAATYTVVISNGGLAAGAASLVDPLPTGVTYVQGSATASAGPAPTFDGANLAWAGAIPMGQRVTVTFQVNVIAVNGWITNTAVISDPSLTAPVVRPIGRQVAAPVLSTSALWPDKTGVQVGGRLTYTLVIRNSGLVTTTAASAVNELPAGVIADASAVTATNGVAGVAGAVVTWAGIVAPGGSVTVTIPVSALDWCGSSFSATAVISDSPLLAPVVVASPAVQTYAALVVNEAFEGGTFPPAGWVVTGTPGNCAWGLATSSNQTGGSGNFAYANSVACGIGNVMTTELRTPAFSLAGVPVPALQFKYDYRHSGAQSASVDISENGAAGPWTTLWARTANDRGPQTAQLDLLPYVGKTDLMVRFRFLSPAPNQWWQIDDVRVMALCPVSVGPAQQADRCRGSIASYVLNVANTSAAPRTIQVAALSSAWPTLISPATLNLSPYSSGPVTVTVRVPWETPGNSDTVTILATEPGSGSKGATTIRTSAAGTCQAWEVSPDSPHAVQGPGLAYHNGYLYQIGGKDTTNTPLSNTYRYHIATGVWETLTNLLEPVWGMDVAVVNDNLYVFGGAINMNGTLQSKAAQVYSTVSGAWSRVADMFTPVTFHRTVALNGNLYVIGGYSGSSVVTSTYVYYPASNSWGPSAPLNTPRRSAAAGTIGGRIYIAGGNDGPSALSSMEVFSPALSAWLPGANMPQPMTELSDGVLGGRYLVVAGGRITTTSTSRVYVYDTLAATWSPLPDLNAPRQNAGADSDGQTMFVIGGGEPNGASLVSSARNERTVLCATCYPQDTLALNPTFTHMAISPPWPAIRFTSVATGTPPVVFSWDFGDGVHAYAYDTSIVHTYTQGGLYWVVMTATNACGSTTYSRTVLVAAHGVTMKPATLVAAVDTTDNTAAPGITYTLRVTNSGNISDTFLLSASGAWTMTVTPTSTGELLPGAAAQVDVRVRVFVPPNAVTGTRDIAAITARSVKNPGIYATTVATTTAIGCHPIASVSVWPQPGGQLFVGGLTRFTAVAAGAPPFRYAWFVNGAPSGANMGYFDFVPGSAGTRTISVTVSNPCSQFTGQLSVPVNALAAGQPDLSNSSLSASRLSAGVGDVVTHTITLRNRTNTPATATVADTIPDHTTLVLDSLSPGMLKVGNQVVWNGQVVSGTPVVLHFAVTVVDTLAWGQPITNLANINNGLGNEISLQTVTSFAPNAWLTVNDGAPYTQNSGVSLRFSPPPGAAHVQFGNDPGFSQAGGAGPLLPVGGASPSGWLLPTYGQQVSPRTVYARFRNAAGYWMSPILADDILYDTLPPAVASVQIITGTAVLNGAEAPAGTEAVVTLRVTTNDANTGVDEIRVSNQPGCAGATSYPATGALTTITGWNMPAGGAYVCAVDRAGNVSAPFATSGGPGVKVYVPVARR